MLEISISKNKVNLKSESGEYNASFDSLSLHLDKNIEGMTILIGSQPENLKPIKQKSETSIITKDVAELPTEDKLESIKKRLANREVKTPKKTSDYIADVFQQVRMPLNTNDLAEIIYELTEYDSKAEKQPNNLGSAMRREPERFVRYENRLWLLLSLEDELKEEGKLPWLDSSQDDIFNEDIEG